MERDTSSADAGIASSSTARTVLLGSHSTKFPITGPDNFTQKTCLPKLIQGLWLHNTCVMTKKCYQAGLLSWQGLEAVLR
jgi:hypothetical protein